MRGQQKPKNKNLYADGSRSRFPLAPGPLQCLSHSLLYTHLAPNHHFFRCPLSVTLLNYKSNKVMVSSHQILRHSQGPGDDQ